jgi:hypothetical protein
MNAENSGRKVSRHRLFKLLVESLPLSVFIGVYRWLKNSFHHRCTQMNTEKNLMKSGGNRLWSRVSCLGQGAA